MDFNLKQWRYQQQQDSSDSELQQQQQPTAKLPRLVLDLHHTHQLQRQEHHQQKQQEALPLFVPEALTSKLSDLSAFPPHHSTTTTTTRFPKMGSGSTTGGYFSMGQWQELELQAMIFRHMLAGAAVPPQLLQLIVKNSPAHIINTSPSLSPPPTPPPSSYYLHHPHLQHYTPYHSALLQSGYWGRGSMDPEPGRCRRTDGKKWRCSRDVVAGHKYCERHVHRGRNRSRKPVENPTLPSCTAAATTATSSGGGADGTGGGSKVLNNSTANALLADRSLAGGNNFDLCGPSQSMDLFHLNQRSSDSRTEVNGVFGNPNEVSGDGKRVLRHFFDDWPRSLEDPDNTRSSSNATPVTTSSTGLSILTRVNSSSDFSLKLSTGNEDDHRLQEGTTSVEKDRLSRLNWASGWGTSQVAPMGGPLAEALRSSSASNSSPKSVLHQLPRSSTSDTSYVST